MRISSEIDDRLMRETMRCSGARTMKSAVETALQLLVRTYAQGAIARHRGKVIWEGPGGRGTKEVSSCFCSRRHSHHRPVWTKFLQRTPCDFLAGVGRRGVPRLRKIVRERTILLRSG